MLMGATFPLVLRASLRGARPLGEDASVLYAANTAGGIAGTLLAGFWLIGGHRHRRVVPRGGGDQRRGRPDRDRPVDWRASRAPRPTGRPSKTWRTSRPHRSAGRLLAVFAVSGFASLALEVVWFRVLVLFLQVTTYAFTVMLAAFLSGIAAGSAVDARLFRKRRDWLLWLVAIEALLALAVGALAAAARPLVRRAAAAGALAGPARPSGATRSCCWPASSRCSRRPS